MIEREQHTGSWVLSPGCLIDRLLDHIEKLSSFVVPSQADDRSHADAEIKARVEQFGV